MDILSLIKKHIGVRLNSLQTIEVVIVESVNYKTWKCSVRQKARVSMNGEEYILPIILDVPIIIPKAGETCIMLPIEPGDIGTCVFSKHALDNLLLDKTTNSITIPRHYDANDAMYIGGVHTQGETVQQVVAGELLVHHHTGAHLKFYANGNIQLYTPRNIEIKANRVDINEA